MVFFKPVYFPDLPKLEQTTINGKRHYIDPLGSVLQKGVALPSVTTALSKVGEAGLKFWKKRVGEAEANRVSGRALKNGNELHSIIENYLGNNPINEFKNEVSLKLFEQMKPELHKINKIRAQEVQLYSTKLGVAGRVDCVAEYDGVLSVIDFKSARKKKQKSWILKYYLQATCYSLMVEEITKIKIDQIVILISAEDGTVVPYIENRENYIQTLKDVIIDYKMRLEMDSDI